ncbi:MAG: helix-turn-helix transcriptional regulator [Truepera sp.]|jgi:DNA-binding CsgD family transcriptional regulator|nr:helix-turn-helix transcriptional regulator [Truepera sp.]
MARKAPVINVIAADLSYHRLIQHALEHIEASASEQPGPYSAHLLLDFPMAWAIGRLTEMNSLDRAKTLIVTQGTHDAYRDLLASFHISGVVGTSDLRAIVAGIYAAASSLKTYQWKSGLTYMELRVTRLLLQGLDTSSAAETLRVSQKTINAHVSNILNKLGIESRAQYIAALLGHNQL